MVFPISPRVNVPPIRTAAGGFTVEAVLIRTVGPTMLAVALMEEASTAAGLAAETAADVDSAPAEFVKRMMCKTDALLGRGYSVGF